MLEEANDFREECDTLAALLNDARADTFTIATQFKGWTIEDVIAHLHMWNIAADLTLQSREKFQEFFTFVMTRMGAGDNHPKLQRAWLQEYHDGISGRALFEAWANFYPTLADHYFRRRPANARCLGWTGYEHESKNYCAPDGNLGPWTRSV